MRRGGSCRAVQAFSSALNSADVGLVTWVAYLAVSQKSASEIVPALSPAVQLCLIQQVCYHHSLSCTSTSRRGCLIDEDGRGRATAFATPVLQ